MWPQFKSSLKECLKEADDKSNCSSNLEYLYHELITCLKHSKARIQSRMFTQLKKLSHKAETAALKILAGTITGYLCGMLIESDIAALSTLVGSITGFLLCFIPVNFKPLETISAMGMFLGGTWTLSYCDLESGTSIALLIIILAVFAATTTFSLAVISSFIRRKPKSTFQESRNMLLEQLQKKNSAWYQWKSFGTECKSVARESTAGFLYYLKSNDSSITEFKNLWSEMEKNAASHCAAHES
jgi:ABC-type multidrug transport system fused ATPase/permease subunit